MTPDCGYTLEYQIQLKDLITGVYSPLPAAFLTNTNDLDFSVFTFDPTVIGNYYISIIATVPAVFQNPTYSEELIITVKVKNQCKIDQVTPLFVIPNELYYIAETGLRSFVPTWSTAVTGCPVTYQIGRIVNGLERPLSAAEKIVI